MPGCDLRNMIMLTAPFRTGRFCMGRAIAACLLAMALCIAASLPSAAQTPVRFTLDWRFEGPSALFLMALEKGYFKAEGLDVTIDPGTGSREAVTRVASGTHDIGLGDVNALIRHRDENPAFDMKAVMMIHDKPPFSIVGRKSRGVTSDVKSLVGRKFGAPAADASFALWPIFKTVNALDDSTMKFENIGSPVREPMLASGEVDAVFGFATTSYINLKFRGIPVEDITVLLMADHGVELYGNAVMVSPKFLAENPGAVRGFIRALIKGIRHVAANPGEGAARAVKRNDLAKIDAETERLMMMLDQNVLTPWVKANGIGGIDRARFARAIDQIGLTFSFKDKARAADAFDDSFLPGLADRIF